jgi:hypothetical protein
MKFFNALNASEVIDALKAAIDTPRNGIINGTNRANILRGTSITI